MNLSRSPLFVTLLLSVLLFALLWWWNEGLGVAQNMLYAENIVPERWNPLGFVGDGMARVLGSVACLLSGLAIAQSAVKNMLYYNKNMSSAVVFILASSFMLTDSGVLPAMTAALLLTVSYNNTLRSYPINNPAIRRTFHASFYYGLATFFYPPLIYLLPLNLALLSLIRLFEVREWIVMATVWTVPFAFYFLGEWTLGGDIAAQWQLLWDAITLQDGTFRALGSVEWMGFIGGYILFVFSALTYGIALFFKNFGVFRKRAKAAHIFFVILLVWSLLLFFISPARSLYFTPIVAVSVAYLLPLLFSTCKRVWLVNAIYLALFSLVIFQLLH